ncbi:VOC family protein [Micromonospora sp. NPDC051296]|uniref:VOC family protein n=1 Tax=Micromonospora sp. NPDC051296 TaxID=3155046 RepID=UPI003426364C
MGGINREHVRLHSVPCLLVDQVVEAAEYYRDRLGFTHVELLEDPPVAAVVRRGSAAVLLQAVKQSGDVSLRQFAEHAWDALFEVDDIEALATDLRRRHANVQVGLGITPVSDRTLEVRDKWGNVLAFAERADRRRLSARRIARAAVPAPVRRSWAQARRDREDRPHQRELQRFCRSLRGSDPFYMYFTRGLLHWVYQAQRHVPADVNLVLLGSDLPDAEVDWLRANVDRPLHNIRLGVDDNTTWEFLFRANDRNFGWLDIDCFVLAPQLFAEMAMIADDVAVNGIWTYPVADGLPIACTHFAFVNLQAAHALHRGGAAMSPTNYDWRGSNISLMHPRTHCRVPSPRQRRELLKVLPPDAHGRPRPPGGSPFFDTLVAYQVSAYANGYRTHPVRPLAHRTEDSLGETANGKRVWQQDMSPEVVHVGGVSYYQRYFHSPALRAMYLAAEYAMLHGLVDRLPASYGGRLARITTGLAHHRLRPSDAVALVHHHLTEDRGLPGPAADQVLGGKP